MIAFANFDMDNLDNLNFALGGLEGITILTQAEYKEKYQGKKEMKKKESEEFVDLKTEVGEEERMRESTMSF